MLYSDNKTFDQKLSPNHYVTCIFSMYLFTLKKFLILYIDNITSNETNLGIKILINIARINSILHTIVKNEIKNDVITR